jgi:hypothetical protein
MFRSIFSTCLEIVGFSALVIGVALMSVPISLIVGGVVLMVAGGLTA